MIVTQRQLEKMGLDEEPAKKRKGGRYVEHAYPSGGKPPLRFEGKRYRGSDHFSTAKAPGPQGPSAAQLIEEAKQRRRADRERERSR